MQRASRLGFGLLLGAAISATGAGISIAHANANAGATPLPVPTSLTAISTLPVLASNNYGSGNGLYGFSVGGVGILGKTKYAGSSNGLTEAGIIGLDISTSDQTNNGVLGSTGSGGFGVRGVSSDHAEGGLGGFATTGTGMLANSTSGYGASIFGGFAGANISSGSGPGANITSSTATGASIASISGTGASIASTSGIGAVIASALGTWDALGTASSVLPARPAALVASAGSDYVVGLYSGTQGANATHEFPLTAYGFNQNNLLTGYFYTNSLGDIFYNGTVNTSIHTRAGLDVSAYSSKSTESTVEDTGTAQLVAGTAIVRLDPAYAQSIDLLQPYRVFLTPDGDTNGLYVAQKTATSFLVRESRGGHSSVGFDYRIVASATGRAADRMAVITPATRAKLFPMSASHATWVRPASAPHAPALRDLLKRGDHFRPE